MKIFIAMGIHYISIVVGTNAFARHTKHIKYSYCTIISNYNSLKLQYEFLRDDCTRYIIKVLGRYHLLDRLVTGYIVTKVP